MKKIVAPVLILAAVITLSGCGAQQNNKTELDQVKEKANQSKAYIPKNTVELDNYNKAQEIYDNPASIQWCTAFPSSNSAPIITMPIAGKLTTSNTSYFSPTEVYDNANGMVNIPSRSVDALYHGESFYRYGFTPAGQYVDFSNSLELLCTTALTDFQRQNTYVEGVGNDGDASKMDLTKRQKEAEEALKNGDSAKATEILKGK
jgi:hypothetical protein